MSNSNNVFHLRDTFSRYITSHYIRVIILSGAVSSQNLDRSFDRSIEEAKGQKKREKEIAKRAHSTRLTHCASEMLAARMIRRAENSFGIPDLRRWTKPWADWNGS